jgi:hypothetical protein
MRPVTDDAFDAPSVRLEILLDVSQAGPGG